MSSTKPEIRMKKAWKYDILKEMMTVPEKEGDYYERENVETAGSCLVFVSCVYDEYMGGIPL